MYLPLPYTECYVKKSFLMGPENFKWGADEMIFGILIGFKAIRNEAPLFEVYLPDYAACYDKVLQPAIFNKKFACTEKIEMNDVAWWDCLSDECELYQKPIRMFIEAEMPTKRKVQGDYLWTIDWCRDPNLQGQWNVWNEHKQKNFFWDEHTGALCCTPNNKMRYYDLSLTNSKVKKPFFKVFKGTWSHEQWATDDQFLGDTDWDYEKK